MNQAINAWFIYLTMGLQERKVGCFNILVTSEALF
jgi:hypothetical protein